ncbi:MULTISPECIES: NAD(P)-dependent alcohol dehydrogenase [unclassified Rathayibacter]|uniref:NAD(P)-dependent alcohol dehydrogenase n=1 Tax=unclassified Rathayibacter TaxID=2609250 RepID=UPI000CE8D1CC|nr:MULTISPECIES: NAD(P)-dependent alcohol dehydrogenase [unclassified Rathayibacter]PPG81656.1 alcohol dehydrogenase [Rathayibacter sp. AY1E5]PPH28180.1 alcohol dehydrogenase [Rathayibacter sp. AY1C3]PPH62779.1 alcohol dehydrogenase [Rathayibacter sp. AY1D7]PPI34365.1 alcohol dehydrogenase [Rathayibacter sp. AY1B4]
MLTTALLAERPGDSLRPTVVERRELRADDLDVRVDFCGVCHSDLHALGADAGFPLVPGHEFVGEVLAVGTGVTAFHPGDAVAVGNIVDSCGECGMCRAGQENFCASFPTLTYGGTDRIDGTPTLGAYSGRYVVSERFAYALPEGLDPAAAAPLLCAGITVWEPLRASGVGPGTRLGVAGLGGLGHLAVRLGAALGAEVTLLTTSPGREADARRLGAQHVVVTTDAEALTAARDSLDVVIDTVSAPHDPADYLRVLALDGTLFLLGHLGTVTVDVLDLLVGRKRLASAGSGGRRCTQDLLDFCAAEGVAPEVEVLPVAEVGTALDRLARNDVRYRFVLDLRGIDDDLR